MKSFLKKIIISFFQAFESNDFGYSLKKLLATFFSLLAAWVIAHWVRNGDLTRLGEVLTIILSFISILLGISAVQAIKAAKKKDGEPPQLP